MGMVRVPMMPAHDSDGDVILIFWYVRDDFLFRAPGGAGSGGRPRPKLEKARPVEGEAGGGERPGWGVPTAVAAVLAGEADTLPTHSNYCPKVQHVAVVC